MTTERRSFIITGGCGFLGSHLALTLAAQDQRVFAVDNFCTGSRFNEKLLKENPNITVLEADICGDWEKIFSGHDCTGLKSIFHMASPASPPHYQRLGIETMHANSIGLEKALRWADKHKARAVFASTSEIYGDPNVSPQPEGYWGNVNTVGVRSCYDEAKRYGEALITTWNIQHKTKHGFFRIFNTYGPRMNPEDGRVVINFLVQALKGQSLTVYGHGKQTRSFCFVNDLVRGILAYEQKGLTEAVNLGNESEFTILELVEEVKKLFPGKNFAVEHLPMPSDDPQQRRPDITKAKTLLGWSPQVKLADGLKLTLDWIKTL